MTIFLHYWQSTGNWISRCDMMTIGMNLWWDAKSCSGTSLSRSTCVLPSSSIMSHYYCFHRLSTLHTRNNKKLATTVAFFLTLHPTEYLASGWSWTIGINHHYEHTSIHRINNFNFLLHDLSPHSRSPLHLCSKLCMNNFNHMQMKMQTQTY
jgi:hypothetical protein